MTKTIRVLVVDDFLSFRQWVRARLEETRFVVVGEAADAREACEQAREIAPDLILLDLTLPDMSGLEAQKALRCVAPYAKVLFLSAYDDADVVRCAFEYGARGYVLKSDAREELITAMEAVIQCRNFMSSGLKQPGKTQRDPALFVHQFAELT